MDMNTPLTSRPLSAIIFDLDGTLIDSKEVMLEAYYGAYQEVIGDNNPPPFSEYCQHLGRSFPEIMRRMGLPQEMHPVFIRESINNMHKIRLFEGVLQMLKALYRQKVPMAIATGKDYARTCSILSYLGLDHYFQMVVGSDCVKKPKPAPEMALTIAQKLQLDRDTTLFVGDAIADLKCGQQAGMQTALALWDHPSEDTVSYPANYHLDRPEQLDPLFAVNLTARLEATRLLRCMTKNR